MQEIISNLPNPIEVLFNPISYLIYAIFLILALLEYILPARRLPKVRYWKLKGIVFFLFFFLLSSYLPLLTDEWFSQYRLIDLTELSIVQGALIAFLSYEIIGYAYHRFIHHSNFMWRVFHQMHHSAERLDTYSSYYFNPTDMIGWTLVNSFSMVLVVGVSAESAMYAILFISFLGMFTHSNIRTPYWLGFIIQRPESHSVHHEKGVHKYNYTELPIIDMLFGTFKNPQSRNIETGFYEGGSNKILDMFLFKDINKAK